MRIKTSLVLILGILAVSTASLFIRYAQQGAPSLVIAFYRMGFTVLAITPVVLWKRRSEVRSLPAPGLFAMILAGFFLAIHFYAWISSLEYTSVASSVVLVTTSPLWVTALSPLVLKENPSRWLVAGLALAFSGMIIVAGSSLCNISQAGFNCQFTTISGGSNTSLGNFLALVGALTGAGYLLIGRKIRQSVSLLVYTFIVYGSSAIFLLLFLLGQQIPVGGYSGNVLFWCLALALIPQLLGHTSFNYALKYLPAAFVSIALLGEPVGSSILAVIFLQEAPALIEIAGSVLILSGIVLSSLGSKAK